MEYIDESHPILAAILRVRHRNAADFSDHSKHSGIRHEAKDKAILECYEEVKKELEKDIGPNESPDPPAAAEVVAPEGLRQDLVDWYCEFGHVRGLHENHADWVGSRPYLSPSGQRTADQHIAVLDWLLERANNEHSD